MAFGVSLCVSAIVLLWLHLTIGPPAQRVNVRFAPAIANADRLRIEQQFGLTAGIERKQRTWSYLLRDRSRKNISSLLNNPSVEDTAHIDRSSFKVRLDRADLRPWLRALIETDQLPAIAMLAALIGLTAIWRPRREALKALHGALKALRGALKALRHAVHYVRAEGSIRVSQFLGFDQANPPRLRELAVGVGLGLVFLTPLLLYGPADDEEGGLGFFSSQIQYRELLLHGRWLYWLNDLGFGTPLPLGHSQALNPVFALGSLVSLRLALSLVWVLLVAIMVVYFLRLAVVSGFGPLLRTVLLVSYIFSAASVVLFYWTDWLSHLVAWSLYPVLVYYIRDAILGGARERFWMTGIRLGLIAGFCVMNSHPGYLVALVIPLGVYVLAAAPHLRVYGALISAAIFALLMSADRAYFTLSEMARFPAELARASGPGYRPSDYLSAAISPVIPLANMREPFLGAVMLCAAVISVWRVPRLRDPHIRGCIIAFVAALALSLTPMGLLKWTGVSGGWLFRDPMIFFGLLSAGVVLQAGLNRWTRRRSLIGVLLAFQLVQQAVTIRTGFLGVYFQRDRLQFYRHQGHPFGLGRAMLDHANRYGKRIYFSENARLLARGSLSDVGVHFLTDFVFLGLNPLNGWFKNVSMDRLSPSIASMHGLIRGQREVIENAALLDVLGINLVLTTSIDPAPPPGLVRIGTMPLKTYHGALESYANPDAWPEVTLLSTDALHVPLPLVAGCGHDGALCRRYDGLLEKRLPDRVSVASTNGEYQIHVTASTAERLLFLSVFYRPEWTATSSAGGALRIDPVAGAFLGVRVPAGVQELRVVFVPRARVALTWLGVVSTASLLVLCSVVAWRQRLTRTGRDTHPAGSP